MNSSTEKESTLASKKAYQYVRQEEIDSLSDFTWVFYDKEMAQYSWEDTMSRTVKTSQMLKIAVWYKAANKIKT